MAKYVRSLPHRATFMRALLLQLRNQAPALRAVGAVLLLPIVVLYVVVALQPFMPFALLLRDANSHLNDAAYGTAFFYGALSNLGVLLWWSAACVCAFAAFLLSRHTRSHALQRAFLAYLALFTGLLALDDLFMLHEGVLPVLLGVPESVMFVLYGALSVGFVAFWRIILEADFGFLMLAFSFFALSVAADQNMFIVLFNISAGVNLLFEDLAKMLGIVCWLVFALRFAAQTLKS